MNAIRKREDDGYEFTFAAKVAIGVLTTLFSGAVIGGVLAWSDSRSMGGKLDDLMNHQIQMQKDLTVFRDLCQENRINRLRNEEVIRALETRIRELEKSP